MSSLLIHQSVHANFGSGPFYFASDHVAKEIFGRYYKQKRDALIAFMASAYSIDELGGLRGTLFEKYAHSVLSAGGKFKARELGERPSSTEEDAFDLSITSNPTLVFSQDSQVQKTKDFYYLPQSKNYESVDAFIKPGRLFQMTVAENHSCKQNGLHKTLKLLGNPLDAQLIFVVPSTSFSTFKFQKYLDAGGQTLIRPTYLNVQRLRQYVLAIDLK